jgi:hypothetical protein
MRLRFTSTKTHLLVLLGLVAFWGCAKTSDNNSASSKKEPAAAVESTPKTASGPKAPSGAPSTPSAAAIATADGEKSGTRVEITELKRSSDNTVTLKFALVNDSDKQIGFGYEYGDKANEIKDYGSIGGVNLVDSAGKKKYFVVRDTESNCLCSRGVENIAPASRANLWAKFPAPPDDVQKISIVIPHFGPLDDVPISH